MKVNKKLIEKAQGRFLITSKGTFLCDSFVKELQEILPDYKLSRCFDIDNFMEVYDRGDLFEDTKHIIALYDIKKEDLDILESILDIDTEDILVFIETKTVAKTKAYTRIKAVCEGIKFESPKEQACITWVSKELSFRKLKYEGKVPEVVVGRSGTDLQTLYNEIKKLALLCPDRVITEDLCEDVVSPSQGAEYFAFSENFFRRRVDKTMREFYKVGEQAYVQLTHFMLGQIERLYRAAIFKEQGHNDDDAASLMGVPKFILKTKYYSVLGFYGKTKLMRLMDLFNELDLKLRTSRLNKRLLTESYLLKALKL